MSNKKKKNNDFVKSISSYNIFLTSFLTFIYFHFFIWLLQVLVAALGT